MIGPLSPLDLLETSCRGKECVGILLLTTSLNGPPTSPVCGTLCVIGASSKARQVRILCMEAG